MYERSYKNRVLKPEPEKPRAFKIFKRVVIVLVISALIYGIIFCLRYHKFQIQRIDVSGSFVIDPNDISKFATEKLQGNYLRFIPKTGIFVLRPKTLAAQIKKQFPYIETIQVKRNNLSSISVSITEYKGVYLWCTNPEACYFMNKNGLVFSPAPYFSGSAYIRVFGREDLKEVRAEDGEVTLPFTPLKPESFALIPKAVDLLGNASIAPIAFHFEQPHSLDISFAHHSKEAQLYIDPTKDLEVQVQGLLSALRTQALRTLYEDENKKLLYLDTRFNDKVVYKFE